MDNYVIHFHHANIQITDASLPIKEQLGRLVDNAEALEKEEAWMPLVRLLVAALKPIAIYKIEHAASTSDQQPYINLIILFANSDHTPITEYEPILQLARLGGERTQCSFHRFHTVAQWIAEGHPFYCQHFIKKNLIYSDWTKELKEADHAIIQQMKTVSRNCFYALFNKAKEFHQSAVFIYGQPGRSALIGFMLHQAIELGYRSILESLNGHGSKTHSIRRLKNQALRCAPLLGEIFPDDSNAEQKLMQLLEDSYSLARYDKNFALNDNEISVLLLRSEHFLNELEELFVIESLVDFS